MPSDLQKSTLLSREAGLIGKNPVLHHPLRARVFNLDDDVVNVTEDLWTVDAMLR